MIRRALSSPFQLIHLLQACSASRALIQGKQVHRQIILSGLHQNPFFRTKLIQMYADCDDLNSAQILIHKMTQPNVFALTAFLGFYSRHRLTEECIRTYGQLRLMGIVPDSYVFPKVLRACAQSSCLDVGAQVHKDVIIFGSEFNIQVCNFIIDMYSKCGNTKSARQVFDEMSERDVLSWNSIISGYVGNWLFKQAVEMLGYMKLEGCEPDIVTWNTIMDAYCRMGLSNEAYKIFKQIKDPNVISWTTIISGYTSIGKHEIALEIFKDMVNSWTVLPDVDSLSSILVSCRYSRALERGKEIHGYGIKSIAQCTFYKSAGAALLTMYASCCRLRDAEKVFHIMDKSDVVTWNAMIFGFIELGLGHLALECFREMQMRGIKNDHTTISTVLPICDLRSGKQIHAYFMKSSFNFVIHVYNAIIHMYSICGCIAYAHSVFSAMLARDVVSWNTIIGGFGMHGLGQTSLELLQQMDGSCLRPDSVTLSSALSACSHSGLVDQGIELFYGMTKDFGIAPVIAHYSCVVDMLARAGRLEDAYNFVNKMHLKPDKHIWGALLAACQDHQNVTVGELAAEHLIRLEPHDAGHYVTLSNIYARAGRWDDAERIRKLMEDHGSLKRSGNSVIAP
ncbi:pentatricopeptide repeat-containing protein At5g39350-like isoform X1 [Neltuma alba]|uniref:pentatricopeptide repeat-containing protein At5g39350-like isoform X1 n=1 Tax=Neltuma alba TaxID=207710 RepID=UPI0010A4E6E1|nr:pentatricopeptide repeat-containing protein At5g39350-like isoform X1 [Prosopis alba]